MRDVKVKYKAQCDAKHFTFQPIWSWDNPRFHGSVEAGDWEPEFNITEENFSQLPTYSPDMHCMVENSHAIICTALQKDINRHQPGPGDSMQLYLDKLQARFSTMLTPEWGISSLRRLFSTTLPAILREKGHYPVKQKR